MIQGFYNAAVGAQQQMLRMDVHANNISNVNTGGFKAQVPSFQELMYNHINGLQEDLARGSGSYMSGTATNTEQGSLTQTGRSLDYAITGQGYFALYDPATGEVSFTRDGAFTMAGFQTGNGTEYYLSDGEGRQVLGQNGAPILVTDPTVELPVGVFDIQYQDGLERAGSSRFLTSAKNGQVVLLAGEQPKQGMLEESNTDLANELTQVIEAQRSYSYALKALQTADEVETTISSLPNA